MMHYRSQGYRCLGTRPCIEAAVALLGSKWLDIVPKMTSGAGLNRLEGAIRCFLYAVEYL
jgi:hypothetical protein